MHSFIDDYAAQDHHLADSNVMGRSSRHPDYAISEGNTDIKTPNFVCVCLCMCAFKCVSVSVFGKAYLCQCMCLCIRVFVCNKRFHVHVCVDV